MRPLVIAGGALAALVLLGRKGVQGVSSRASFLRLVGDEVARHLEELRPDLSPTARRNVGAIVASMWAHESGFGKTRQWREGWNGGNVSAGSSWVGPVIDGGDLEYDAAGNVKRIAQKWRRYESLAAAVSDFFRLLSLTRYRPARDALMRGDAPAFVELLRSGGYFTAPVDEYRAAVARLMPEATRALA